MPLELSLKENAEGAEALAVALTGAGNAATRAGKPNLARELFNANATARRLAGDIRKAMAAGVEE